MRQSLLDELTADTQDRDPVDMCRELLQHCRDGRIKLWTTAQVLNFRRDHRNLFQRGDYVPLHTIRGREEHIVAFARYYEGQAAITVVPGSLAR